MNLYALNMTACHMRHFARELRFFITNIVLMPLQNRKGAVLLTTLH